MRGKRWLAVAGLVAIGLMLGALAGHLPLRGGLASLSGVAAAQATPPGAGHVLLAFGVGGVLTADGGVWQYRPDNDQWYTMDEAFRQEGRETHVVPLPVAAGEIAQMASFGFIVTKSGDTWLYEISTDKWRKLSRPA